MNELEKPDWKKAEDLFDSVMEWLGGEYKNFHFYVERDLVWTIQKELKKRIAAGENGFEVFNDYPMIQQAGARALSTDLAILRGDQVLLAVEFKFEPTRGGVEFTTMGKKWPVVEFGWHRDGSEKCPKGKPVGVHRDIKRVEDFVVDEFCRADYQRINRADVAIAVFVDEDGWFQERYKQLLSCTDYKWTRWEGPNVYVLHARRGKGAQNPGVPKWHQVLLTPPLQSSTSGSPRPFPPPLSS